LTDRNFRGDEHGSYAAVNIAGPPRVYPSMQSSPLAWCPNLTVGPEHVVVQFDNIVEINSVQIYESSTPGKLFSVT